MSCLLQHPINIERSIIQNVQARQRWGYIFPISYNPSKAIPSNSNTDDDPDSTNTTPPATKVNITRTPGSLFWRDRGKCHESAVYRAYNSYQHQGCTSLRRGYGLRRSRLNVMDAGLIYHTFKFCATEYITDSHVRERKLCCNTTYE